MRGTRTKENDGVGNNGVLWHACKHARVQFPLGRFFFLDMGGVWHIRLDAWDEIFGRNVQAYFCDEGTNKFGVCGA